MLKVTPLLLPIGDRLLRRKKVLDEKNEIEKDDDE